MVTTWQEVKGDETLALDWPIDQNATVWEIGGYEGRWAAQIVEKFNPNMNVFEPQGWAVEKLNTRFAGNEKVIIHPFGLWTHHTIMKLWEHDTDGASVVRNSGRKAEMCDFMDIHSHLIRDVDLCLMNIEGGEYVLLPYLIGLGLMKHFRFFWCQFHPGLVMRGDDKKKLLYAGMKRTHKILWDFYPTAVAWERK